MGKMQRDKGRRFEQYTVKVFQSIFPRSIRNLEYQGELIELGTDVIAGPYHIQCKRCRKYAPVTKIEEVNREHGIPLLITKADYKDAVAVMYLDDFINLLRRKVKDE